MYINIIIIIIIIHILIVLRCRHYKIVFKCIPTIFWTIPLKRIRLNVDDDDLESIFSKVKQSQTCTSRMDPCTITRFSHQNKTILHWLVQKKTRNNLSYILITIFYRWLVVRISVREVIRHINFVSRKNQVP